MKKSKSFLTLILAAILAMNSLLMSVYAAENTTSFIDVFLHAFFGEDDGKVLYDGHYYQLFDEGITWTEADERCKKMGGHLVTITSEDEFNFCKTLLGDMSPKYCWMGATHASGSWEWITGEPWSFTLWSSMENQPNGSGGGTYALMQNCEDVDFAWSWDDQGNSGISPNKKYQEAPYFQITENYCYICEWDTSE